MKLLFIATILSFSFACANAATSIPLDLVGIWATEDSEFKGEALWKGQALYLDTDGIGVGVGGDGTHVGGFRIVLTSYSPKTNVITFDLTDNGKVVASKVLSYDPILKIIFSPTDSKQRYHRRFDGISISMRKSIGLEEKVK